MNSPEMDVLPDSIDVSTWYKPEYLQFQHRKVTEFLAGLTLNPEITNTTTTEDRVRELLDEGNYMLCTELDIPVINGIVDPPELAKLAAGLIAERDEALLNGLSEFKYLSHYRLNL